MLIHRKLKSIFSIEIYARVITNKILYVLFAKYLKFHKNYFNTMTLIIFLIFSKMWVNSFF